MSLHAVLVVGRYQESGQDRAVLASAWETEIKVTLGTHGGRDSSDSVFNKHCFYSTCTQDQTR